MNAEKLRLGGDDYGQFQGTVAILLLKVSGKPRKCSVRIASDIVEIRTTCSQLQVRICTPERDGP
jgi:hypothetical protein